ncbi:MAG: alpha/beta hydrolase [Chloroflexi bacterium]|nr:alpha/beta hydrolase [Chloroflexota bacterium]OJW06492.1 MAG: hypothetical protein BGO39_00315 [Chloroflexi bacterium 54-19]
MDLEGRVDPEYLPMVATMTATDSFAADLPAARKSQTEAMAKLSQASTSPDITIFERNITAPEGHEFMVRIYTPNPRPEGLLPVMVWAHGGGYVVGHPVEHDNVAINFVRGANCAVVSVDYRLAPENPYPAAIEDCYTAMQWVAADPEGLGFDAGKIAVGGYSAGGGLGAAMALLARDRGGPKVVFQMPLCACLDDRHLTPSAQEFTDGRVWSRSISENAWNFYLKGVDRENTPPHAAPARETNLAGLAPAYFGIGELDLMRDENIDYASRLMQAGVSVELHVFPGAFHGFDLLGFDKALGQRALAEYGVVLKRAFDNAK